MENDKIYRREFLKNTIKIGASITVLGSFPLTSIVCSNKKLTSNQDYYISRKTDLLKDFNDMIQKPLFSILINKYDEQKANKIISKSHIEFESLIPKIPYIGGEDCVHTKMLEMTAMALAVYNVLKQIHVSTPEIGDILFKSFETWLKSKPSILLSFYGIYKYHISYDTYLQKQAARSQKREYPMDAVFEYVQGDGKEFDYGVNTKECAIIKFLKTQNAEELAPYMCIIDYPMSKTFNRGLVRTKTLAAGEGLCDFRYKKGRKTKDDFKPGD